MQLAKQALHLSIDGDTKDPAEYRRAEALCKWAEPLAIQGFVRRIETMEVFLCDIDNAPLELIGKTQLANNAQQSRDDLTFELWAVGSVRRALTTAS